MADKMFPQRENIQTLLSDYVSRKQHGRSKSVRFRDVLENESDNELPVIKQRPYSIPCSKTDATIWRRGKSHKLSARKMQCSEDSEDLFVLTNCPGCGTYLKLTTLANDEFETRNFTGDGTCIFHPNNIRCGYNSCGNIRPCSENCEIEDNKYVKDYTSNEVRYKLSCAFTVKRKVKTRNPTRLYNRSVSSEDFQRQSSQSCKCVINSFHCENKSKNDDSKVKLRHSGKANLRYNKQRPCSDSALDKKKGSLHLFEFDENFNPNNNEVKENEMKTGLSKKPVRIHLLNNDSVVLVFETKSTVRQLFDQVCTLLSIKEGQFFGLSTVVDNEKWFMDLKHKISKYAPKEWGKEIKRRASDLAVSSAAVLTVQFQVQFYVEHPKLISDPTSRQLYYLQIKKNVAKSKVLTQDEILFTIASHALQSDLGDHNTSAHKGHYFRPEDYFPAWFIEKWGRDYLLSHLPSLHAEHKGRSSFDSQALYIQQASGIDDVPVHYYKLYKNKKETKPSVLLGIFHQGIRIHYGNPDKMQQTPWKLEFEFMWNKVGRLFFTEKRFEIYPEDLPACRRLTFYTGSHSRSKYLLHFLRETHSLYMSLSPYAQQMRRVDGKKSKRRYRESYIAGKNLESADTTSNEQHSTDNEDEIKSKQQGREKSYYRSMTSHGSSHTSGIESDSKQRTEEDEDDEEEDHYADDFDPIEVDHNLEEIIDVTEDHLVAPPSKSLSVNNLADPQLTEMKLKPLKDNVSVAKKSGKPSRDNTLTGEDFCIVSDVSLMCDNKNSDSRTPKHLSVSSENRDDTLKNGVPLDLLINAVQKSKISDKRNSEERQQSSKHTHADHGGRKHRKKVRSFIDMSTQTATPGKPLNTQQKHVDDRMQLYYDDFHTIPRKPRVRSHTEDPKVQYSNKYLDYPKYHQLHHMPNSTNNEKRNAKRISSEHFLSNNHSESIPSWKLTNHPIQRTQSSDNAGPVVFITDEKVKHRHGKSVNSIPSALYLNESAKVQKRHSAFVPVSRNGQQSGLCEKGYYTVARGHDKYVYYDDVRSLAPRNEITSGTYDARKRHHKKEHHHPHSPEKPRHSHNTRSSSNYSYGDQGRLSSFEDEDFSQKMSEACMRTLSAQRRKLSDSRFAHRMDSGRGSLRTDDSSSGLDVPHLNDTQDFLGSPHTPASRPSHLQYDLLRTPFIENYNEVIV